jgi:hypothetical protein
LLAIFRLRHAITGHWSLVTGHWSLVTGHWPQRQFITTRYRFDDGLQSLATKSTDFQVAAPANTHCKSVGT